MRALIIGTIAAVLAASGAAQESFTTEWGDPDLQGLWGNATITPLERPAALADRTHLTEAEAEAIRGTGLALFLGALEGAAELELTGELSEVWLEPGTEVVRSRRTSLVVDPPDGKVPYTQEGAGRARHVQFQRSGAAPADSYEDRHLADRCLAHLSLYLPNPFYLNHHMIFQTRSHVAILSEYDSEFRIIPLGDRPPLEPAIALWAGDSRGHWEGSTLVVETTHFNGRTLFQGASEGLRLVERFTRVDADTIDYQLTASDPASYTRPWTIENTLRTTPGPIYEFACHEGNYGLPNILSGARAKEKAALENASPVK